MQKGRQSIIAKQVPACRHEAKDRTTHFPSIRYEVLSTAAEYVIMLVVCRAQQVFMYSYSVVVFCL